MDLLHHLLHTASVLLTEAGGAQQHLPRADAWSVSPSYTGRTCVSMATSTRFPRAFSPGTEGLGEQLGFQHVLCLQDSVNLDHILSPNQAPTLQLLLGF